MNPGPETGLNARKFGFKARTKYGVYIIKTQYKLIKIKLIRNITRNTK